jgi:hypothetical protein
MTKEIIFALGLISILSGTPQITHSANKEGLCLTEQEFTNFNAMTLDQIRNFLISKNSFLKGRDVTKNPPDYTFQDADGTSTDAAAIIYEAAQTNKINPKVLLTTLQKEEIAITTRTTPLPAVLKLLAGCGGGSSSAKKQIQCMAQKFKEYFHDELAQCQATPGGWQVDGGYPPAKKQIAGETLFLRNRGIRVPLHYGSIPLGRVFRSAAETGQRSHPLHRKSLNW